MSEIPPPPPTDLPPMDASMGADPKDKWNWAGITALIIGVVNICSWFIPFCGCPMGLAGIIIGVLGLKSNKRGFAIGGIILSLISMVATVINFALAIWLNMKK